VVRIGVLALLWGSGFLWIKVSLNHGLSPAQITITRCVLGAAVLAGLALAARQRLPRSATVWRRLAVAALFCNALPFALFAVGERTVDSGLAGVLNATTPLWTLLIGLATGVERFSAARAGGLLLGFGGVLLIFAPWQLAGASTWGAVALLAAAASYGVGFVYMGRWLTGRGTAPIALSAAQLIAATGWSAVALPAAGAPSTDLTGLAAVAVLGVFGTGVTFYLSYRLIADEGPTSAATVGYLLPVVSVALGAVFLDERLGARVLLGMAVVLLAVALTRRTVPAPPAGPSAGGQPPEQLCGGATPACRATPRGGAPGRS
jgi:drug/metabolite transporter (DMT)-like permease